MEDLSREMSDAISEEVRSSGRRNRRSRHLGRDDYSFPEPSSSLPTEDPMALLNNIMSDDSLGPMGSPMGPNDLLNPGIDTSAHSMVSSIPSAAETAASLDQLMASDPTASDAPDVSLDDIIPDSDPLGTSNSAINNDASHTPIFVVWIVIMVVALLLAVIAIVGRNNRPKEIVVEDNDASSNYIELYNLNTDGEYYTDYMTVHKVIDVTSANVICLLTGEAENYGAVVAVPVSTKEFNNVNEGQRIAIHFDQLSIDDDNFINVVKWEKMKG